MIVYWQYKFQPSAGLPKVEMFHSESKSNVICDVHNFE